MTSTKDSEVTNSSLKILGASSEELEDIDAKDLLELSLAFDVSNGSTFKWDIVRVRAQLLTDGDAVLAEVRTDIGSIEPGSTKRSSIKFWGINKNLLRHNGTEATFLLEFVACRKVVYEEILLPIPELPFEISTAFPAQSEHPISMDSCAVWKTNIGDANEYTIETRVLARNTTDKLVPMFKLNFHMHDRSGNPAGYSSSSREMPSGTIHLFQEAGYLKAKGASKATISLGATAYITVETLSTKSQLQIND